MRTFLTVFLGGLAGVGIMLVFRSSNWCQGLDAFINLYLQSEPNSAQVSREASLVLGAVISFALAWVSTDIARPPQRHLVAFGTIVLLITGALVLSLHGFVFSPILPLLGGIVSFVTTEALMKVGPGAMRRKIEETFGPSLSRRARLVLAENSSSDFSHPRLSRVSILTLHFEPPERYLQVMQPDEWANMNRLYLRYASDYLCEVGAYLESVNANFLRAVFGAPLSLENPAQVAARCAHEIITRLEKLNLEADSLWRQFLEFRIGLATGTCLIGNFGAPRGKPYAVAGVALDFSIQLCEIAAFYGCKALLCSQTFQEAEETVEVRPIDLIRAPDGSDVEIYELLCLKGGLSPERKRSRDAFWSGVNHFRAQRWDEAVEEFARARIKGIPDSVIDAYLQRIDSLKKNSGSPMVSDMRLPHRP